SGCITETFFTFVAYSLIKKSKTMKKILLSFLMMGAVSLTSVAQNPIANNDFENWNSFQVMIDTGVNISLEAPVSWSGSDSLLAGYALIASIFGIDIEPVQQIFQSADANSGTSAAAVVSAFIGDSIGVIGGVLSIGRPMLDLLDPD